MKIKLSLVPVFLFLAFPIIAQNIPNPSFEAWTPSGSEPPFDWEEPTDWKSNNAAVEFSGAAITKTEDAHDNEFAVKLTTSNLFGEVVPAMLVNGNPTVDFQSYMVNVETGGTPLSDLTDLTMSLPFQMNGYYKFETTSDYDSAFVEVLLTKFNTETNVVDTTAYGSYLLSPENQFSPFSVLILDLGTGIEPDNIIVAFYSTNPNNPLPSGQFIVDQIDFPFLIGNIDNSTALTSEVMLYPNPVSSHLRIALANDHSEKTIEIHSLAGNKITTMVTQKQTAEINFEDLENGVYIVRVFDKSHHLINTKRVVKI